MDETSFEQGDALIGEIMDKVSSMRNQETDIKSLSESENANTDTLKSSIDTHELSVEMVHLLELSNEMTNLLSNLLQKAQIYSEQVADSQSEIDSKKTELEYLQGIIEERYKEKEHHENLIRAQRSLWDEEKKQREEEDLEYSENRRIRWEKEEEEYRRTREEKHEAARARLQAELQTLQREYTAKQEATEKNLSERESALKEKEDKWLQISQEMESFIFNLSNRMHE